MDKTEAYYNGTWISGQDIHLPIDDLGFLLGATVVERMRTFRGKIFRLDDHLHRLHHSLEIVAWDGDKICRQVEAACEEFLQRNAGLLDKGNDWTIVAFVTPGKTIDAAHPTVCVHGNPLPFHNWAHQYQSGVKAVIVDVRQVSDTCWPAELKCRSRMHYYLAERQAAAALPGAKAILLDQDGHVGEGTAANVVAYFGNRGLVTPLRSKVLPGISQQVLFELADSVGIPHSEEDLLPEQLAKAGEAFFTSTSSCLLPIVQIDGKLLGEGGPGAIFQQLLAAWSTLVNVDIVAQARLRVER